MKKLLTLALVFVTSTANAQWQTPTNTIPLGRGPGVIGFTSTPIPLGISLGGTGQITANAAFGALSPNTTRGDITVRGTTVNQRLALGASGTLIRSNGTDPVWGQVNLTTDVTGILPGLNGGSPWNNNGISVSSNFTVTTSDCGSTFKMGTGNFYTATVNTATGYAQECAFILFNEATARAKIIAINGYSNFFLYPQQGIIVYRVGSGWAIQGRTRWKHGGGTLNLYVNPTFGSDLNDGLAAGAGNAKASIMGCLNTIYNDIDFSFLPQTSAICNVAAGTVDTAGIHLSTHAAVGAQGGAAVIIQGDGGQATIATTGTSAIGVYLETNIQFKNFILTSTGAPCVVAQYKAFIHFLEGMRWDSCVGSAHITATERATIWLANNYDVTGEAAYHYLAQQGGIIKVTATTVTGIATFNFSQYFAYASELGLISSSAAYSTFDNSAGTKAHADYNSVIKQTGGCTTFPGLNAATTAVGGQCP